MEEDEYKGEPTDERRKGDESRSNTPPNASDEYEITAKDAGWRTPTFLVSRVTVTYFDPPRPKKRS